METRREKLVASKKVRKIKRLEKENITAVVIDFLFFGRHHRHKWEQNRSNSVFSHPKKTHKIRKKKAFVDKLVRLFKEIDFFESD